MTVARGFGIIIASCVSFAIAGGGLGYGLAKVLPQYYRVVFRHGEDIQFDPVQVGLGLGMAQGAIAGLFAGAVIVLAVALNGLRRPGKELLEL